jgi:hypothetical protein
MDLPAKYPQMIEMERFHGANPVHFAGRCAAPEFVKLPETMSDDWPGTRQEGSA